MRADLDTLVIAVYCAACALFPAPEPKPRRGRPQKISDNELICLMVAQMLLGCPSERQFLPIAAWRLGLIGSPECRLPLAPVTDATKKAVDDVLARVGLLQAKAAE